MLTSLQTDHLLRSFEINFHPNKKLEMSRRSEICWWSFCSFFVISFILFIVGLCYLFSSVCKETETKLLWEGLGTKLCKDSDFTARVFEDEDACCRIVRLTVCIDSYRLVGELEEVCSAYSDFVSFMKYCCKKASALDMYEITRKLATEYPVNCQPGGGQNHYYYNSY